MPASRCVVGRATRRGMPRRRVVAARARRRSGTPSLRACASCTQRAAVARGIEHVRGQASQASAQDGCLRLRRRSLEIEPCGRRSSTRRRSPRGGAVELTARHRRSRRERCARERLERRATLRRRQPDAYAAQGPRHRVCSASRISSPGELQPLESAGAIPGRSRRRPACRRRFGRRVDSDRRGYRAPVAPGRAAATARPAGASRALPALRAAGSTMTAASARASVASRNASEAARQSYPRSFGQGLRHACCLDPVVTSPDHYGIRDRATGGRSCGPSATRHASRAVPGKS